MDRALVFLALGFFFLGCISSSDTQPPEYFGPTALASQTPVSSPSLVTPFPTPYSSVYPVISSIPSTNDAVPSISTTLTPSNPDRMQAFVLKVSSEDDVGVKTLSWESTDSFSSQPESISFDCGLEKSCFVSWTFASSSDGVKTITAYAVDSSGRESARIPVKITVQPFDYKLPSPAPAATVSSNVFCGNNVCDDKEGFETCPADCPYAGFTCANGKCEGGESYKSCPQDCGVSDIIGSSCGDGACEPGEDASYCPRDCASIKPNCGNNVCDPWESEDSCRADCKGDGEKSCSSNAACGYKQICQSGKCVGVDCTNDGQCGYGKECEGNRCVRCPRGPYGPAC